MLTSEVKMPKYSKNSKMTLDKLGVMTQSEFSAMRKDMVTKGHLDRKLKHVATKEDLKHFATTLDLEDLRHELKGNIQKGTVDVLRAVDKIAVRFDKAEKDHAADKLLHDRHEKRIEAVEVKVGMRGA